ncbi:hypothetical protein [Pediococcus acidilactici]|nr:hypothetical protein [Pediococcus acidilactici]QOP74144.1 hypothetical protein ID874_03180 [Pediococcus acidilactici]
MFKKMLSDIINIQKNVKKNQKKIERKHKQATTSHATQVNQIKKEFNKI